MGNDFFILRVRGCGGDVGNVKEEIILQNDEIYIRGVCI